MNPFASSLSSFFVSGALPAGSITYASADWFFVAVSYIIAALASYLAIIILKHAGEGRQRTLAVAMGAITFGTGVWSMHFTGMLAVKTDMVHDYEVWTTLLSWGIGVLVAYCVFYTLAYRKLALRDVARIAPFLGLGIAAMHYTGMAAMRMQAVMLFQTDLFVLSILIAIAASGAALLLMQRAAAATGLSRRWSHIGAALLMGVAVAGMHYTGMLATVFMPYANCRFDPQQDHMSIVLLIMTCTLLVMGVATLLAVWLKLEAREEIGASRWYYVYYLLAAFNLCTVLMGGYMNRTLMHTHYEAQQVRQDWQTINGDLLEIVQTTAYLGALLDKSHDVTVEPRLVKQHLAFIQQKLNGMRGYVSSLRERYAYLPDVHKLLASMEMALSEADARFSPFIHEYEVHPHEKHSHVMLDTVNHGQIHFFMDGLNNDISQLARDADDLESLLGRKFDNDVVTHSRLTRSLYITLIILVILATTGGVQVAKRIRKTQEDSLRHLSKAQASQAQLEEMQRFLKKVIDNVADPIFVKNRHHQWIEVNEAFCEIIGYSREELIGKSDFDLFPMEQASVFWEMDEKIFAGGVMVANEEKILSQAGDDRIILTKKVPIAMADGSIGIVGIFHDVTEEVGLREELRQHRDNLQAMVDEQTQDLVAAKERAEQANHAKSEFLSNMSHELRTPIHAIRSFAQLSIDLACEPAGEQRVKKMLQFMQNITLSADRLNLLVNDLLDMAKLESGRIDYQFEPSNVLRLIEQSFDQLQALMFDKHLRYDINAPVDIGLIEIDYRSIMQVMINVLSNAIKFSPDEGWLLCNVARHEDHIIITLRDQGPGIPENEMNSVFDKFVQSSKTKTKAGGTGLGLAICRQIVEDHNGRIWFENNTDGVGATVFIRLPLTHTFV